MTFFNTNFSKYADFDSSIFAAQTWFSSTQFSGIADFYGTYFSKLVEFNNAIFTSMADFRNATFTKDANFDSTKFGTEANFSHLQLKDSCKLHFDNTVFPKILDFSNNPNIVDKIYLSTGNFYDDSFYKAKTKQYKPHLINLYRTDICKFHLDYIHFKLLIPDSTNEHKMVSLDEKESIYEALLHNFDIHGQKESYKLLDIEYQSFKWDHSWASWFTWLPRYWWNFGYEKEYIFLWVLGVVILFTLTTFPILNYLNTNVYKVENIPICSPPKSKLTVNRCFTRLWYSFIYTTSIFFKLTLKIENIQYNISIALFRNIVL